MKLFMRLGAMLLGLALVVPAFAAEGDSSNPAPAQNSNANPAKPDNPAGATAPESMQAPAEPKAAADTTDKKEAANLKADIKIGTGLENREATGVSESFNGVSQVVGWTRIQGAAEPTEVKHVWLLDGKEQTEVSLPVKSSSYRTWSRKTITGPGKWTLQVKDSAGNVVASKDFDVASVAAAPAAPAANEKPAQPEMQNNAPQQPQAQPAQPAQPEAAPQKPQ